MTENRPLWKSGEAKPWSYAQVDGGEESGRGESWREGGFYFPLTV